VDPQDDFLFTDPFTEENWREAVNLYSPSQMSLGRERSYATVTAYIDWNRLKACCRWLLGWAYVGDDLSLRRFRPARHPIWPKLSATEVLELRGITFTEKQVIITDTQDLPFAKYDKAQITVAFSQLPYLLTDDDGEYDTEDERWTTFTKKPYVDFLELPGGEIKFVADNPAKAWHNQPTLGPRVIVRAAKSLYTLTHYQVPYSYIFDLDGATPKIDDAIGKISSDVYAGKPAGTFLLDDVDIEIHSDPVVGDIMDSLGWMCTVKYFMKFFDPPRGHGTDTTRGWLLEPAVDGQWYPTTRAVGTAAKYLSTAFADLFTHWDA
jgi:hypothetical protein